MFAAAALALLVIALLLWAASYQLAACFVAVACIASLGVAVALLGLKKRRVVRKAVAAWDLPTKRIRVTLAVLEVAAYTLVFCGAALVVLAFFAAYTLVAG